MKTYNKTIIRSVKSNISRFISITAIILIGICFVTGVGGITPKIRNSFNEEMRRENVSDLIIKSKSQMGFTSSDLAKIKSLNFVLDESLISSIDTNDSRTYYYSFKDNKINNIKLIKGRMPKKIGEIVVEEDSKTIDEKKLGEFINIFNNQYKVVGIVRNPLMYYKDGDDSITSKKPLNLVCYIDSDYNTLMFPKTDILVRLKNKYNYFDKKYLDLVKVDKNKIRSINNFKNSYILTLKENKSYAILKNICDKIDIIAAIFPLFFIFVVSLVVLTTMSRLVNEERSIIGCYKSLGYSSNIILLKYFIFSLLCLVIGILLGLISGAIILPNIIYPAFDIVFFIPKMTKILTFDLGIITSLIMGLVVIIVTMFSAFRDVLDKPSSLLKYKTPKAGKKILLERIGFIWNRLSFKYKSSFRNIFRYVGRLLMIVISLSGCSALVFAGFGLRDISDGTIVFNGIEVDTGGTITIIAVAIVVFALILSVLVLYNLTNMNIGERKRELATLKVLGYSNKEVNGYIFREIFIMSFVGIVIGIPLGLGLLYVILDMLDFGSISEIKVVSYFNTLFLLIIFIIFVDVLLSKKIKNIDMNDALKTLE